MVEVEWPVIEDPWLVFFLCFLDLELVLVDLADMLVGAPTNRAAAKAVPSRVVVNRFIVFPL